MKDKLNRDEMNSLPYGVVAADVMSLFSVVQDLPKERRVLALCLAMKLMTDHLQINPQDPMVVASNLIAAAQKEDRQRRIPAIMQYLKEDL